MEVSDTIKTLDISKSEGPNGIPSKILHMLVKDISPLLADLFNLSFSAGAFPSTLKTAKLYQFIKSYKKKIVLIIDLSLFYLILTKFLKD